MKKIGIILTILTAVALPTQLSFAEVTGNISEQINSANVVIHQIAQAKDNLKPFKANYDFFISTNQGEILAARGKYYEKEGSYASSSEAPSKYLDITKGGYRYRIDLSNDTVVSKRFYFDPENEIENLVKNYMVDLSETADLYKLNFAKRTGENAEYPITIQLEISKVNFLILRKHIKNSDGLEMEIKIRYEIQDGFPVKKAVNEE